MADDPRNQENQRRQGQESSQASQDLGKMLSQQKELNLTGGEFVTILKEIAKAQKEAANAAQRTYSENAKAKDEAKKQSEAAQKYARQQKLQQQYIAERTKSSISLASQLAKFSREDLKSSSKKAKFESTLRKTYDDQISLLDEAKKIRLKAENSSGELKELELEKAKALENQVETSQDLLSEAEKLKRTYTTLGRLKAPFQGLEKIVSSIPIVKDVFSELTKMTEEVSDTFIETGDKTRAFMSGVEQFGKGILQTLGNALLLGLVRGLVGLDRATASLQNSLNITAKEASNLYRRLDAIAGLSAGEFSLDDLQIAAGNLSLGFRSSAVASNQTIKTVAVLTQRLGISADEAASLFGFAAATNKSFTGATEAIIGQVEALNDATEVSLTYSDILKDIANVGAATALSTEKFPGGIAKAAFEARRFGLTLSQLEKTQSSLLDFSQSITDEINAEVLLNRSLNLDRARYFALTNDLAGLAREMYEQADGFEGFEEMLFPQQQAFARAFGMSRDEAAEAIKNRQALIDLEKEAGVELVDKSQEQQIANLIELYKKEDPKIEVEDARIKALEALGLKEQALGARRLKQQQEAIEGTSKLTNLLENFGTSLAVLVTKLTGRDNPFDDLVNVIASLEQFLRNFAVRVGFDTGYARFGATEGERNALMAEYSSKLSALQIPDEYLKNIQAIANQEITDKTSKEDRTKIETAQRTLELRQVVVGVSSSDLEEAIFESQKELGPLASNEKIAKTDALRKNTDLILESLDELNKLYGKEGLTFELDLDKLPTAEPNTPPDNTTIPANDFTIRTHPQDTLVMAGGTKLGSDNKKTNELLERLINAVERGGSVYLDGRKVGEALVINTTRQ